MSIFRVEFLLTTLEACLCTCVLLLGRRCSKIRQPHHTCCKCLQTVRSPARHESALSSRSAVLCVHLLARALRLLPSASAPADFSCIAMYEHDRRWLACHVLTMHYCHLSLSSAGKLVPELICCGTYQSGPPPAPCMLLLSR